ncbi:hypothetical protein EYF80_035968 [Liparis tanakae]|uniref:Uncharacterized protein n=1 Tax=Liparis tanakae TaxID=230148 RepID=A0A4Z2GLZ1_9TELE|nr:hypothetical protein EYF80_035968 [Liparis tanakae]
MRVRASVTGNSSFSSGGGRHDTRQVAPDQNEGAKELHMSQLSTHVGDRRPNGIVPINSVGSTVPAGQRIRRAASSCDEGSPAVCRCPACVVLKMLNGPMSGGGRLKA